ncbi:hypothetical protein PO124_08525 [Bacillus licheniformis]|nr:hypothetical protein [Bacillus licheniformis]
MATAISLTETRKRRKSTAEDFLKQFKVSVLTVGVEGGNGYPKTSFR